MELTREDLLRAASRAATYRSGYGREWSDDAEANEGHCYLPNLMVGESSPAIGCPAVALAVGRPHWNFRTITDAYHALYQLWGRFAHSPYDYDTALNFRPLVVAAELRRIAATFPPEGVSPCV